MLNTVPVVGARLYSSFALDAIVEEITPDTVRISFWNILPSGAQVHSVDGYYSPDKMKRVYTDHEFLSLDVAPGDTFKLHNGIGYIKLSDERITVKHFDPDRQLVVVWGRKTKFQIISLDEIRKLIRRKRLVRV